MNQNVYTLLSTIDGILNRLWAVKVKKTLTGPQGPTQWLFLCEPKSPLEDELVRTTTEPSAPCFFGSGVAHSEQSLPNLVEYTSVPPLVKDPDDQTHSIENPLLPLQEDGRPLPKPRKGQVPYCVDYRLLQILSGVRSVLLVLIDSCALCARDSDFVGIQPASDVLHAVKMMSTWSEAAFVPNAKYWKDWPLARFLRNPLPPKPETWKHGNTDPLFGGETGHFFRRLATYDDTRPDAFNFYRAVFGIAQSKRGFAQVPASFVQRSLAKHAKQLSTPPSSDPDLGYARVFMETFLGEKWRPPRIFDSLPRVDASPRASVESTRFEGGARAHLQMLSRALTGSRGFDEFLGFRSHAGSTVLEDRGTIPLTPQLWRKLAEFYTPKVARSYLPDHVKRSVLSAERDYLASIPEGPLQSWARQHVEFWERHPEMKSELTSGQIDEVEMALKHGREIDLEGIYNPFQSLPFARVAPILEPLKVRTITAMDAVRSHVSRPLQAAMFRLLRSSPVFQLIGEPISESILHDLNTRHRKDAGSKSDDEFVSGDYSAATDGLDIRLSKALLDPILDRLHPEDQPYRDFIASCLLEQVLVYPSGGPSPTVQANGQLMGSVLSFPFLCLANLFAFIQARPDVDQLIQSRKLIDALPVLINGDDILFRTNASFYQRWLYEIDKVGFVPSVGKNFKHPRFFTVNSVPIEYQDALAPSEFWKRFGSWADIDAVGDRIPYLVNQDPIITIGGFLNVGLLTGQAKLTGKEDKQDLPLSSWYAQSVLPALHPAQAHRWFLHYHSKEIRQQTMFGGTTLNLFAHPLLGGLGFPIPPGVEPRFSPEQRRIAHSLFLSACFTYEGQEKDFSLPTLIALSAPTLGSGRVGSIPRKVEVSLYPSGTPLPPNLESFVDESGIDPIIMSNPHVYGEGIPEDFRLKVSCRLSGPRIRSLTKRFGIETVDLHPLESMTFFPFYPVKRVVPDRAYTGECFLFSPFNPFTDVSLPTLEETWDAPFSGEDIIPSPLPQSVILVEPEDWETQDFALLLPSHMREVTSHTAPLPSIRNHPGRQRLRASQAFNRKFPRPSRPRYMTQGVQGPPY